MDALNKKLDRHRNVTRQMKSLIFVPLTFFIIMFECLVNSFEPLKLLRSINSNMF